MTPIGSPNPKGSGKVADAIAHADCQRFLDDLPSLSFENYFAMRDRRRPSVTRFISIPTVPDGFAYKLFHRDQK